jgi:hypothetical protein
MGVALTAVLAIAVALVVWPNAQCFFNDTKAWELTTQFLFVAVLGGAVSLIYRSWEAKRETRAVQRKSLEEFYRSFNNLHNEYKKIRRTLEATSFPDPEGRRLIERGTFEKLMDQLEDCQLRAEGMVREFKAQRNYLLINSIYFLAV